MPPVIELHAARPRARCRAAPTASAGPRRAAPAPRARQWVEEAGLLDRHRLDALQTAVWPAAMAGDLEAVRQVTTLIEERARLLGLYPVGRHHPEEPLRPVTSIVPEGWSYDEQRREWDVTPKAP